MLLPAGAMNPKIYHKGWIDFNKNGRKDIYEDPGQSIDRRVEDLISRMTLEEKTCQLATLYGFGRVLRDSMPTPAWQDAIWKDGIANIDEQLNGVRGLNRAYPLIYPFSAHVEALNETQRWFIEHTRLGIPAEFSNEGIHGLTHHKATPLPAPIGIGSTWNRELVHRAGQIVGREAYLLGYHSVYAPILDLPRDPRWGRTLECYSEDPYLTAELGIPMSRGIQEEGVASTLKHYAAYSVPSGGRDGNCRTDPHINPRELHEIYLYPFRRVIREAQPLEVMSSYNDWNGEPVSASYYFLTQLLRDEYGFRGYVVSDSDAVEYVYNKHNVASSYEEAVKMVLEAGLNVRTTFTPPADFILPVRQLLSDGRLSMETVDRRVREVLRVKFELGLFDQPFRASEPADREVGADKQDGFVREVQAQAMVLLKNEGGLLPLDASRTRKVLVTGPLADETNFMLSRYGPNGLEPVSVRKGLQGYGGLDVRYARGCSVTDKGWPYTELVPAPLTDEEEAELQEAVDAAADVDVIIAVLGEDEQTVGESRSRSSLDLPGRQQELLDRLVATGKPVVLVLINGQPLTINRAQATVPAILEAWFPNYKGGEVIAQMLFGDLSPSGKLPVTFPRSIGQIEFAFPFKKGAHNGQPGSGQNGIGRTRVLGSLYPFGYGLTYTSFDYGNLQISEDRDGVLHVSAEITNTGSRPGTEIVQLYVRDQVSSVVTYDSLLRGFERISLDPQQSGTVHFLLKPEDLQILDKEMNWAVEPGEFEIRIGASSEDIRLRGSITR